MAEDNVAVNRVTVGYQDGCLAPLWLSRTATTVARVLGAQAIWYPDHFMGFAPKWLWTPEVVPAASVLPSMDALFDPVPLMTRTEALLPRSPRSRRRPWTHPGFRETRRRNRLALLGRWPGRTCCFSSANAMSGVSRLRRSGGSVEESARKRGDRRLSLSAEADLAVPREGHGNALPISREG